MMAETAARGFLFNLIDLYDAHITCLMVLYTYTYENKIGRQLVKAPQAVAIGPLLISTPPPHP